MISFDERGGGDSVNLNPIYSSLQMLSMVKLDSSIFNNFTSTFSGGGFDYLVDYSNGKLLNKTYMYNITGTLPSDGIGVEQLRGYDLVMGSVSGLSAGPYTLGGFKRFYSNSFQGTPTMSLFDVSSFANNTFNNGTNFDVNNYTIGRKNIYSNIYHLNMYGRNGYNYSDTYSTNKTLNISVGNNSAVSYIGNNFLNLNAVDLTQNTFNFNSQLNIDCYNVYTCSWINNTSMNLRCRYLGFCTLEDFFGGFNLIARSLVSNTFYTIPRIDISAQYFSKGDFTSIGKLNLDCNQLSKPLMNQVLKGNINCNTMTGAQITQCSYMDIQGVEAYDNSLSMCNEKIRLSFGTITNLYIKSVGEITIECDELRSIRCENVNKCVVKCKTLRTPYWFFSISTLVLDYDSISYTYTYATDDRNMRDLSTVYMKNYTESNFYWSTPFGSHVDLHIQNKHDIFNGSTYTISWDRQYVYIGDTPVSLLNIS